MIIYRPHRNGLAESLAEAKEFETEEEMKEYIFNYHKNFFNSIGRDDAPFDIGDIVIDKSNSYKDDRCGWNDTMYVCVKRYGKDIFMEKYGTPQCIGVCATNYATREV